MRLFSFFFILAFFGGICFGDDFSGGTAFEWGMQPGSMWNVSASTYGGSSQRRGILRINYLSDSSKITIKRWGLVGPHLLLGSCVPDGELQFLYSPALSSLTFMSLDPVPLRLSNAKTGSTKDGVVWTFVPDIFNLFFTW